MRIETYPIYKPGEYKLLRIRQRACSGIRGKMMKRMQIFMMLY